MGLYECVVVARVKSGEGIREETGDVAACSWLIAVCLLGFAVHTAQMLCWQSQTCR